MADRLDDIKKAGVLRVGVLGTNPPFGFVEAGSTTPVGPRCGLRRRDRQTAGRAKPEFRATNPANRIPPLASQKVGYRCRELHHYR
ncbi:hypothetical protein ACU4GD_13645 [Cupriavidus basilensis]